MGDQPCQLGAGLCGERLWYGFRKTLRETTIMACKLPHAHRSQSLSMQGGVDSAAGAPGKTGKRPAQSGALLATRAVQKLRWRPSVTWSISLRRVDSLRAPEPRAHAFSLFPPCARCLHVNFHRETAHNR